MRERRTYYCGHCKKSLNTGTDIIRFNKNAVYHLECYIEYINKDRDFDSFPCPRCYTTGKFWNKELNHWVKCRLCNGAGFLVVHVEDEELIKTEEEKNIDLQIEHNS